MYRKLLSRFFLLAGLFVIISSCAKISSPSGGPRDRIPPVVINNVPENGAKNFRGNRLTTTFDEYVVLDNINEKFMVSPPMKVKPRIFLRGKSVNVEFEEELKDSTTYTFYFQDAIKDLNEGNVIENYQFVFSTGPVLDSLSVTGNLYNSFDLEVPEKTMVLMFSNQDDSAVVKNLPDYISRVDQTGYFRIDNVRPGTYRLYGLQDIDNSKNYNLKEEQFAFMDTVIVVTSENNFLPEVIDTSIVKTDLVEVKEPVVKGNEAVVKVAEPVTKKGKHQLFLYGALKTDHYLTSSSRSSKYQMLYTLSLPPDSMRFEFSIEGTDESGYLLERSRNRDTLKVWLTDSSLFSQQQLTTIVKYPFTDTLKITDYKEDTILMRFIEPRAPRGTTVRKPAFAVDANIRGGALKPGQDIVLRSQTPFRQPDTTRISLYETTDTSRIKIPFSLIKDSLNTCRYSIKSSFEPGKRYLFIADSASFGNIYNDNSDSTGIKFLVRTTDSYGKLTLNISNYDGDRIIQLLGNSEKLISEIYMKKDGDAVFPLLERGLYRIRVIYDLNGDGKWTTGNFANRRQPEPVSYYNQELEIKTDWELEQPWDIGVLNAKDQILKVKKTTR